jgi:Ala-tRNA(Pro) deacylase
MSVPATVTSYLDSQGVQYELIAHEYTSDSMNTARSAHVPGNQLAKCVLLEDRDGYLMAVIPATHRIDLQAVRRRFDRSLCLATEPELPNIFRDCEPGAIPPLGGAYGIEAIVDESLIGLDDIYFEAGDHRDVVHVSGDDFIRLMAEIPRGQFSHPGPG